MLTKITEGFYIDLDGIVALEADDDAFGDEEFYVYVDTRDCPISLTSEKFKALCDIIDKRNQELTAQPVPLWQIPQTAPLAPPVPFSVNIPKVSHWQNGRITVGDIWAAPGKHSKEV